MRKAPLGQKSVIGEETRGVLGLVEVSVSGLHSIGGQQH
jgi:hypothetical protein